LTFIATCATLTKARKSMEKGKEIIDSWDKAGRKDGHYSIFTGFEKEIRSSCAADLYDQLVILDQVKLYRFIIDLLVDGSRLNNDFK
jgi:hypothetical protein